MKRRYLNEKVVVVTVFDDLKAKHAFCMASLKKYNEDRKDKDKAI